MSTKYRYFCLDAFGELHGAQWFYADSDEEAAAQIGAKHPHARCEIWQDQRLVAKLGFDSSDAHDPIVQSRQSIAHSRRVLRQTAHLLTPPFRRDDGGDAR